MSNEIEQIAKGSLDSLFSKVSQMWTNRRLKKRLKSMLNDKRFPNGYRSISQLQEGIGKDDGATKELLIAIGARKSENSDEWTLNPPR